jgi:8-oxo-dGTP diphosphatase
MPNLEPTRATPLIDACWRVALRVGFTLARVWWRIRRPDHRGALVAIYVGESILLVKSSYRKEWSFPGGSIDPHETPDAGALRELKEEIGFISPPLKPAGSIRGIWDGRPDQVHFYELHLGQLPELRLDNREIIAARLASPDELRSMPLTGPVVAYLDSKRAR